MHDARVPAPPGASALHVEGSPKRRAHRLYAITHPIRTLGFLTFILILWIEKSEWTGLHHAVIALFLVWPQLVHYVGARVAPSSTGAQAMVVLDCVVFGLAWVPFRSFAVLSVAIPACAVNSLSIGGAKLLVASLLGFGASTALGMALYGGLDRLVTPSMPVLITGTSITTVYCAAVGFGVYAQGISIKKSRRMLRDLSQRLEEKVEQRTQQLRSANEAFLCFVPAEFLRTLGYDDITKARLGDAAARDLTILFADVRNFTAMSESMGPEQTFAFLNACLSRVGPHVRVHGGFVDKFIGDAIMALFPGNPASAVRAAVAMHREVDDYNRTRESNLAIGVGVYAGLVMMGTIGERERFEATVISDAVNITARLESLTKLFGCRIIITTEVSRHLTDEEMAMTRRLGTFIVKGKVDAVELVEVFAADEPEQREHKVASREAFHRGIEQYQAGQIVESIALFRAILDLAPADGPAGWWLKHCMQELSAGSPNTPGGAVRLNEK